MTKKSKIEETGFKEFSRRDVAVKILKSMGMPKSEYNHYITKKNDKHILDYVGAQAFLKRAEAKVTAATQPDTLPAENKSTESTEATVLASLAAKGKKKAAAAAAVIPPAKPAKAKKEAGEKRVTVSSVARELILKGLDNQKIFDQLHEQFGLDVSKKWYPAWYRSDMRRKGLLK